MAKQDKIAEKKNSSKYEKLTSLASQPLLSSARKKNNALSIWLCASAFYLYEMILRVSPSVMTDGLMRDFSVTATSLGVLSSFYYYAYVLLQIPCGLIVDKIGTRRVVTLSSALCTIGTLIFAMSDSLWLAQLGRFLIGAGSACAFISCLKVSADWFSPSRFAFMACLTNMMGTIGGIFAKAPLAILVNKCGWQLASLILAAAGVMMTFLSWIFIRDYIHHRLTEASESGNLVQCLQKIASSPQVWLIATIGALLYMPISAFTELWVEPYLMHLYGVNNEVASLASTMIFIGFAIGGPLAAWYSDRKESRISTIRLSSFGLLATFLAIVLVPVSLPTMFAFMFMAGILSGGEVLTFSCVKEMFPNRMSGAAVGFTNAVVMMSGVIFQPLLGGLLDFSWDGTLTSEGIRVYSTQTYQLSMLAIPVALAISWILLYRARETYGQKS